MEYIYPVFRELKNILPLTVDHLVERPSFVPTLSWEGPAKPLGITRKFGVNDLIVIPYGHVSNSHMGTEHADRFVRHIPFDDQLPNIRYYRYHVRERGAMPGMGINIFETKTTPAVRYAIVQMMDVNGDATKYLVCLKGCLFRIQRNSLRMMKVDAKFTVPILEDGMLDDIIADTVGFIRQAERFEEYGAHVRRGIIFDGSAGNGKSLCCRYIRDLCSKHNIRQKTVTASEIDGAYGQGTLNQLFSAAQILFFDDIDVSYFTRKGGNGKIACSILSAMDGMVDNMHVVRIFTTNEDMADLDPAFTRPGRIDRRYNFKKPTAKLRRQLVDTWPKKLIDNIDVDRLVTETNDKSFAELEAVRDMLVQHFVFKGKWDLDAAIEELDIRRDSIMEKFEKRKVAGFGGAIEDDVEY